MMLVGVRLGGVGEGDDNEWGSGWGRGEGIWGEGGIMVEVGDLLDLVLEVGE